MLDDLESRLIRAEFDEASGERSSKIANNSGTHIRNNESSISKKTFQNVCNFVFIFESLADKLCYGTYRQRRTLYVLTLRLRTSSGTRSPRRKLRKTCETT